MLKSKAIFLDRDGVINVDRHYVHRPEDFVFKAGIFDLMRYVIELGYKIFVVTNQSGIARGYYSLEEYETLSTWMLEQLQWRRIKIEKVYYCPHDEQAGCDCRKPKPGMILQANREFDLELESSWMVGDKESDIQAGIAAGVGRTVLVAGKEGVDYENSQADFLVYDLKEIKEFIKE